MKNLGIYADLIKFLVCSGWYVVLLHFYGKLCVGCHSTTFLIFGLGWLGFIVFCHLWASNFCKLVIIYPTSSWLKRFAKLSIMLVVLIQMNCWWMWLCSSNHLSMSQIRIFSVPVDMREVTDFMEWKKYLFFICCCLWMIGYIFWGQGNVMSRTRVQNIGHALYWHWIENLPPS